MRVTSYETGLGFVNKYADLEFLSLVDRISKDYNQFVKLLVGAEHEALPMSHTAFRVLVECHQSEEEMSDNDVTHLMRLEEADFSQALIELIGLEYVYTSLHPDEEGAKLIHLTVQGVMLAERFGVLMDNIVEDNENLSNLLLTDIEREQMLLSLIAMQNRTKSLLRKLSS